MKKVYVKPMLICEDLQPETMLCGCDVKNPTFSDLEMCSYAIDVEGAFSQFVLFGETWANCAQDNESLAGTDYYYCYYGPGTSIFSS